MPTSIITRGSRVSIAGRRSRGLSPAFSRASAAYQSDGRKVGVGVPRFEAVGGRRGVLVEEGTTNTVALAAWNPVRDTQYHMVTKTSETLYEQPVYRCVQKTTSTPPFYIRTFDIPNGATYTASIWTMHEDPASGGHPFLRFGKGGLLAQRIGTRSGEWERLVVTYTNNTGATISGVGVLFYVAPAAGEATCFTCPQIEAKPYATSFVDGTRTAEVLALPVSEILSPDQGALELTVTPANSYSGTAQIHFEANAGSTNKNQVFIFNEGGLWKAGLVDASGAWRRVDWSYDGQARLPTTLAITWSNCNSGNADARVAVYEDGVPKGTKNDVKVDMNAFTICTVGRRAAYSSFWGNAAYSDLLLYRRALSDEEIAAHAAGNIVAGDCYHYPFDGNLWPAPGSLGAVVAPAVTTRPGRVDVVTRRGSVDIITRPGKLEVIRR